MGVGITLTVNVIFWKMSWRLNRLNTISYPPFILIVTIENRNEQYCGNEVCLLCNKQNTSFFYKHALFLKQAQYAYDTSKCEAYYKNAYKYA